MPGVDTAKALEIAEAIRRRVEQYEFTTRDGRKARVTVSAGLATYPKHLQSMGNEVTDLIAAADEQLVVHAKRKGRNRVCYPGY
jgi:diguanylate cyclase (GGDEF)-like protein